MLVILQPVSGNALWYESALVYIAIAATQVLIMRKNKITIVILRALVDYEL